MSGPASFFPAAEARTTGRQRPTSQAPPRQSWPQRPQLRGSVAVSAAQGFAAVTELESASASRAENVVTSRVPSPPSPSDSPPTSPLVDVHATPTVTVASAQIAANPLRSI